MEEKLKKISSNVKNISLLSLIRFSFKILFFEKTFLIFIFIANLFSILVAVIFSFMKSGEMMNEVYDFYVIIFINVFMFLIIIRIINFYFVRKKDDKTIFIALSNHISRSKFFIAEYLTMFITIVFSVIFSYIIFNALYFFMHGFKVSEYVFHKTTYFLIFALIIVIALLNFIIFLILILGSQPTLIISTILMSLSFVANIPAKLVQSKYEALNLTINEKDSSAIKTVISVKDIYESFNLQNSINTGKIKYKYLAKALNNYLTDFSSENPNDYNLKPNKDLASNLKNRYNNFWDQQLNVIDKTKKDYKMSGKLSYLNSDMISSKTGNWKITDQVDVNFSLGSTFKTTQQLQEMIASEETSIEQKNILNDLLNFNQEIWTKIPNMLSDKSSLFKTYIWLYGEELNSPKVEKFVKGEDDKFDLNNLPQKNLSDIKLEINQDLPNLKQIINSLNKANTGLNITENDVEIDNQQTQTKTNCSIKAKSESENFKGSVNVSYNSIEQTNYVLKQENKESVVLAKSDLISIYNILMTGSRPDATNPSVGLFDDDTNSLKEYINTNMNFPLMFTARILEEYFIPYTTNYYYLTTLNLREDSNYVQFKKNLKIAEAISYLNPFYATWSYFTQYTGFYNDNIWFEYSNDSLINTRKQENIFLPYVIYNLKSDDSNVIIKDTYNKYFDPLYSLLIIFSSTIVLIFIAMNRFRKIDIS
ncbi:ABC transporter permease [Spiroplasma tabanidicola]|uniref:ABC transporter permease n=1 Tax=Spiroplasma tabanidicola TaxID=324079 RepID=A0A6I6CBB0_9MOLU|nr:ABC transporter permease [Spiroplasma tabanidicola]QGS52221.1 ABC transporter permease [Spiroplasma tabanidicola]